jgi:hypothetical protein
MSSDNQDIEDRLAAHPFLKGMSMDHIKILAQSAVPTHFEKDQVIFKAGEPANGFYLIESGSVALEGSFKIMGRLRPMSFPPGNLWDGHGFFRPTFGTLARGQPSHAAPFVSLGYCFGNTGRRISLSATNCLKGGVK